MVDLLAILPVYFRPILEFQEIMKTGGAALEQLETSIEQLRSNFYIQTADEKTLRKLEAQFDIVAISGENIENRRQRVLSKYNLIVPFSILFLKERLTELFGSEYSVLVDSQSCMIKITITSSRYGAVDLLYDLLWDIVPAHMRIVASQQVNSQICGDLYLAAVISSTFVQSI